MIVLDTHVWIWWLSEPERLSAAQRAVLARAQGEGGIGVSVLSCWEVAKLVERGRITLDRPVDEWLRNALSDSGVRLLDLTPAVAVASTQLPGAFHRDPADQIIVATARLLGATLVTSDRKILDYEHVETGG